MRTDFSEDDMVRRRTLGIPAVAPRTDEAVRNMMEAALPKLQVLVVTVAETPMASVPPSLGRTIVMKGCAAAARPPPVGELAGGRALAYALVRDSSLDARRKDPGELFRDAHLQP